MDKMVKWRKPRIGIACSTDSFYSAIETIINQHPIRGPHQRTLYHLFKYNQLLSFFFFLLLRCMKLCFTLLDSTNLLVLTFFLFVLVFIYINQS